jgi:hypothetical protein
MLNYTNNMIKMIESGDGVIADSIFVLKPGVSILTKTVLTQEAVDLFEDMHIDTSKEVYQQIGEFNGKLTYNSFADSVTDSNLYTDNMVNKHQHLSVFSGLEIMVLVSGVAIETVLEFVAHHEGKVARLTSSKTKAMSDCLYRVQGHYAQMNAQMAFIKSFLKLRNSAKGTIEGDNAVELFNMLNLGSKVGAFTISMSLKDWHKTLIGRLSKSGVELDVQEVCELIANKLYDLYPMVIKPASEYYAMKNGAKYKL